MSSAPLYNEKALLMQVAQGDETAFGDLFHAWRDKLYFFILRITNSTEITKDLVQDVFVKLWINRAELNDIEYFSAYLYRIAQNHVINSMKRMAKETSILAGLRRDAVAAGLPVDEALLHKQVQEKLYEIVSKLPAQQRLVYTLRQEQGLRHEEIARRLNISVSTVQNHMNTAMRTIRQKLSHHYPAVSLYILLVITANNS